MHAVYIVNQAPQAFLGFCFGPFVLAHSKCTNQAGDKSSNCVTESRWIHHYLTATTHIYAVPGCAEKQHIPKGCSDSMNGVAHEQRACHKGRLWNDHTLKQQLHAIKAHIQ